MAQREAEVQLARVKRMMLLLPGLSQPVTALGRDLEDSHWDRRGEQPLCCAPGQSCPLLPAALGDPQPVPRAALSAARMSWVAV